MYPEGGVWQTPDIGGRTGDNQRNIGKLKWGVGKLIAHAPQRPVIIPFFQMGAETLYPQHPETKELKNMFPIFGHTIDIIFGPEISFDDLIEEHERLYGPLWKYKPSIKLEETETDEFGNEIPVNFHKYWDSNEEELELYSKITMRIEIELKKLNDEYHSRIC